MTNRDDEQDLVCGNCGGKVLVSDSTCEECGASHCPYCIRPRDESCEHYLASVIFHGPEVYLSEKAKGINLPLIPDLSGWSSRDKRATFGDELSPTIESYEQELADEVAMQGELIDPQDDPAELIRREIKLLGAILCNLDTGVRSTYWETDSLGMSSGGCDYSVEDPDSAHASFKEILEKISRAIWLLRKKEARSQT